MKLNYLFGAVAACSLLAGAAYAQSTASPAPSDTTSGATGSVTAPSTSGSGMSGGSGSMSGPTSGASSGAATGDQAPSSATTPSDTGSTGVNATSATTYGQSASVTTTTMAMNPIPDTRENREKFGGPNSNAGRRTSPKGN